MIPIECPKCGREGNVPPDRLNAKLTCRGCQAVFHLDNSGRMVMGAPGEPGKDKARPHVQYTKPGEGFNLAEAWSNVPIAAKVAVPVVVLGLLAWQLMPDAGGPAYAGAASDVVKALLSNNRSRVVSYSSSSTADAAGKWFDLMHAQVEKRAIPSDSPITPALLSGNPEKESSITMMTALSGSSPGSEPLTVLLQMVREGGGWRIDGAKTLAEGENATAEKPKK